MKNETKSTRRRLLAGIAGLPAVVVASKTAKPDIDPAELQLLKRWWRSISPGENRRMWIHLVSQFTAINEGGVPTTLKRDPERNALIDAKAKEIRTSLGLAGEVREHL